VKYAIKLANSVQVIHGDKCADLCNPQLWEIVLSEYKIFVMTAQVFLNILRKGVAKMSEFCFIAMDECHAAQ
jgi:ERCC4-related helicase